MTSLLNTFSFVWRCSALWLLFRLRHL